MERQQTRPPLAFLLLQGSEYLRVLHRLKRNYSVQSKKDADALMPHLYHRPTLPTVEKAPSVGNCNAIALQVLAKLRSSAMGSTTFTSESLQNLEAACFVGDEMELDTIADSLETIAAASSFALNTEDEEGDPEQDHHQYGDNKWPMSRNDSIGEDDSVLSSLVMGNNTDLFLFEDELLMALHDALAHLTIYKGMSSGITSIMLTCFSRLQHVHDKHFAELSAAHEDSWRSAPNDYSQQGSNQHIRQAAPQIIAEYVNIIQLMRRELVGWNFAGHGGFEVEDDATVENCAKALRKTLQVFAEKRMALYYPELGSGFAAPLAF